MQHVVADRSHDRPPHCAQSSGPHHDQTRFYFAGNVNNGGTWFQPKFYPEFHITDLHA